MTSYLDKHPFLLPTIIASAILLLAIALINFNELLTGLEENDVIDLASIDSYQPPPKKKKRELSDEGEAIDDDSEKSEDSENSNEVFDLAFHPNIRKPGLIGRLPQLYPKKARELGVEATVVLELILNKQGKISRLKVIAVLLKKKLPADLTRELKQDFTRIVKKMLHGQVFERPTLNGKAIMLRLDQEIDMVLK